MFCRFPPPPRVGWVTVAERECQFQAELPTTTATPGTSSTLASLGHHKQEISYSDIWVETRDEVVNKDNDRNSSFLPYLEENHWKRAWAILWGNQGILPALESLQEKADTLGDATPPSLRLAVCLYYVANRILDVYGAQMSLVDVISRYSNLPNWSKSIVRALALHPRLDYLALARQDDEVDVRSLTSAEFRVVLRDRQQMGVACMEWAHHNDHLLAVGASTGVLLWHMDPSSPATRFVTTWVRFECSPGHSPISSLSWSPWGNFIISSSPRDSNLLLWNIPLGVSTRVWRGKGGCVANVEWSPDGRRVFTGNVESVFRVWETGNWTCDRWSNFSGRCKSACWSPNGDILIFALNGDPSLYYLSFHGNEMSTGPSSAIKCADLSPCSLQDADNEQETLMGGGNPRDIAWDSSGKRLAVVFSLESPSAKHVAIFRTSTGPLLQLQPGGFVQGLPDEYPNIIAFKDNFSAGALLVVAWSSGRVSFIPLYFQSPSSSMPEVVLDHTPLIAHAHPAPDELSASLSRPSLYRNHKEDSLFGTSLYSVHL